MSYDLAVWYSATPLTAADAARAHERLGHEEPDDLDEVGRAEGFYADLTARYPDLGGLSEDRLAESPWMVALDVAPGHVAMAVSRKRVPEVKEFALELAERHGLVLFDPQEGEVANPPPLQADPTGRTLTMCDGSVVGDPSIVEIMGSLGTLSDANWFGILEIAPERYAQVGLGTAAGAGEAEYGVECRLGSAVEHYRFVTAEVWRVVRAFEVFLRTGELTDAEDWELVDLT